MTTMRSTICLMSQPCCMAAVDEVVLVVVVVKLQKWSTTETPSSISCLDCTATIMDKISSIHYGEWLVGDN